MFVIRLPNGNLMVPRTATGHDGRILGDVYVEIGPQDADYARLAAQALTPEEAEQRRDQWRQDDEALRQEFLEFARRTASTRGRTPPKTTSRSSRRNAEPVKALEHLRPPQEPRENLIRGNPFTGETAGSLIRQGVVRPPGGLAVDGSLSPRSRALTSDLTEPAVPPRGSDARDAARRPPNG